MPENIAIDDKASLLENPKKLFGLIFAICILLVISTLYFLYESPNPLLGNMVTDEHPENTVPFLPFASPSGAEEDNSTLSIPLDQLTARMAMRLEQNPDDVAGWTLLGRSYVVTGHPDKAIEALKKAIALAPKDIELQISLGEAMVTSANGLVTPEAKEIFLNAKKMEADHPGVRYNLALWEFQAGEVQRAYDSWLKLAEGAPASAPWLNEVAKNLNLAANELAIEPPSLPNLSQPTPALSNLPSALTLKNVRGGEEMTQEDRDEFIRGMVQRLSDRLEQQPEYLEGWLRLAQSYKVLGEKERALASYGRAMELAPEDEKIQELYQNAKSE